MCCVYDCLLVEHDMHLHSITHWEFRKEFASGVKKKQTQCSVDVTREDQLHIFQVVTHC